MPQMGSHAVRDFDEKSITAAVLERLSNAPSAGALHD